MDLQTLATRIAHALLSLLGFNVTTRFNSACVTAPFVVILTEKTRSVKKCLCVLFGLLILGCSSPNEPDSIKELILQKDGIDGIKLYLVLADKSGNPVAANGRCFTYINGWVRPDKYEKLWIDDRNMKQSDFKACSILVDGEERKVLAMPYGRIPYSAFKESPGQLSTVDLLATFDNNGKELKYEGKGQISK